MKTYIVPWSVTLNGEVTVYAEDANHALELARSHYNEQALETARERIENAPDVEWHGEDIGEEYDD